MHENTLCCTETSWFWAKYSKYQIYSNIINLDRCQQTTRRSLFLFPFKHRTTLFAQTKGYYCDSFPFLRQSELLVHFGGMSEWPILNLPFRARSAEFVVCHGCYPMAWESNLGNRNIHKHPIRTLSSGVISASIPCSPYLGALTWKRMTKDGLARIFAPLIDKSHS